MASPQDLRFTRTHEWLRLDGDVATIGISDYAQTELGDITYLELPEVGDQISQSQPFGIVESVKAASDIYAPVDGEVVEVNEALNDDPSLVNAGAQSDGWFCKLRVKDPGELDKLMDEEAYQAYLAEIA